MCYNIITVKKTKKTDRQRFYRRKKDVMMYVVRDREAGNVITEFDTVEEAKKELEKYEAQDKKDGTYSEDFYEIAVID